MELLLLFFEFLKIGFFTIGGGYAMIPLLKETVLKYGWLSETQFYNFTFFFNNVSANSLF